MLWCVHMHVQVSVDVPRTAPNVPFFHEVLVQKSLERLLYIWGIRWVTLFVKHAVCMCVLVCRGVCMCYVCVCLH